MFVRFAIVCAWPTKLWIFADMLASALASSAPSSISCASCARCSPPSRSLVRWSSAAFLSAVLRSAAD